MHRILTSALSLLLLSAAPAYSAPGAETVRLRASVRLAADARTVQLGDVADISGPESHTLAAIHLADAPRGGASIELKIADIRRIMDGADVHWGRTSLSGRSVVVRSRPSLTNGGPSAMTPARVTDPATDDRSATHRVGAERTLEGSDPALRGTLTERLMSLAAAELGVPAAYIRFAVRERDHALLTEAITDLEPEIRLESNWRSDRVGLTIQLRRTDGALERTEQLSLRPLIRTQVATPQRTLAGGETIDQSDITVGESWLSPVQRSRMAAPDDPAGQVADRRLPAGAPIQTPQLRSETLVERGDHVSVRCLVGGLTITMTAEARASGAAGDIIELRKLGERTTFTAAVTGTREVTLDLRR